MLRTAFSAVLLTVIFSGSGFAQTDAQIAALKDRLTGSVMDGYFSMGDGKLFTDRYEIEKARKMPGKLWIITARIKYEQTDVKLPVPVIVEWAGSAPVITLDKVNLPGLGTFSAYVVIDEDQYAGTWHHDELGGHMFGKFEDAEEAAKADDSKTDEDEANDGKDSNAK